jgi:phospholipid/cholesterol/gamma-HCH transport system substrate-binding protein
MQFRVGVVVFATVIVGGLLATLYDPLPTGWLPWGASTYHIGIEVDQAPGIGRNSPVRKNGILIGRVNSIEDKGGKVVLHTDVETDQPLLSNQVPHIRTSVLGDATIDFIPNREIVAPRPIEDGETIQGITDQHPLEALAKLGDLEDDFGRASNALEQAGKKVGDLADNINKAFGNENQQGRVSNLLETTEHAMGQFARTMTAMNEIIGDLPEEAGPPTAIPTQPVRQPPVNSPQQDFAPQPGLAPQPGVTPAPVEGQQLRRNLREGLNQLPEAVQEARQTMKELQQTLELANTNLRNLQEFTEPLGEKGAEFAATLTSAVRGLDLLVRDFHSLTVALNNREGTIGRLIHDGKVYENLNRLMFNANEVLCRVDVFIKSLRPIRDDVRAFTDKVSREPSRVITGALGPPSTVK